MFDIIQIEVLPHNANYNFILHGGGETVVIDPSLSEPVVDVLNENFWQLDRIINTHHHWDHTDGNLELKERYGAKIVGFEGDSKRIPGIDVKVKEGDKIQICGEVAEVMFLPGHTTGHVAYYFEKCGILFSGDVMFAMGCGRLFEGTYQQAYDSLQKIANLPAHTQIYCAHEYTIANAKFAVKAEPDNEDIKVRLKLCEIMRKLSVSTVPTSVEMELMTNPFVRAKDVEEFAKLRKAKDEF